jgi:predicted HTH domain antitoxin
MESIVIRPGDLVESGLFNTEDEAVSAAIADLLDHHPDLRMALAAHLYEQDEDWSIAGIAQWAGVTFWEMKDFLASRGVPLRLGPATADEAREETAVVEALVRERPH